MKNMIICILAMGLISCKASKQISTDRYVKDSTIIREVPVIVEVPGAMIESPSVNLDSLVYLIKSGIKPEIINNTLYREDPETKLRVGLLIDELGNLTALCEQQDRMIDVLQKEITHWKESYEKVTEKVTERWWNTLQKALTHMVLGGVVAAVLFIVFKVVRQ